MIVRDRRDFDRGPGEIDTVPRQPADDRPEGRFERMPRHMREGQIDTAMWRAAPGRHLLLDRIGRDVARRCVARALIAAVIGEEFAAVAIEQPATELVAERVPHDRVHADDARRQMPDRKELHEFHIDKRGAGRERQRIAVTAHVGGCAVALVNAREPASCDDDSLRDNPHRLALGNIERDRADHFAVMHEKIGDSQIADAVYDTDLAYLTPQGRGDRRAGVQEIDIAAARPRMTRGGDLCNPTVLTPRPADSPLRHLADPRWRVAAK